LTFIVTATDSDLPPDTLTYSLDAASIGLRMTIDSSTGTFSWTSTTSQSLGKYHVTVTVVDNGAPPLSESDTFTIVVVGSMWQNPNHYCDITDDGWIKPNDVLILINEINTGGPRDLTTGSPSAPASPPFLDPSGDGWIKPSDVLLVINYINANGSGPIPSSPGGEGESTEQVNPYHLIPVADIGVVAGVLAADSVNRPWECWVPSSIAQPVAAIQATESPLAIDAPAWANQQWLSNADPQRSSATTASSDRDSFTDRPKRIWAAEGMPEDSLALEDILPDIAEDVFHGWEQSVGTT
jgi:hypothetical protein